MLETKHKRLLNQDLSTPRSLVNGCIVCELETECEGMGMRMSVWQGRGCVVTESAECWHDCVCVCVCVYAHISDVGSVPAWPTS